MIPFLSLENCYKKSRLPSTSVTFPSTSFTLIHLHFIVLNISLHHCCALLALAHVPGQWESFPSSSSAWITYTAQGFFSPNSFNNNDHIHSKNLHHPACHIPCFLLSPHFYHPSVPSGIRSFYQWSGASASSGARSRSRWEGWCWKDSAQGGRTEIKLYCCEPEALQWLCLNLSNTHQFFGWLFIPQNPST